MINNTQTYTDTQLLRRVWDRELIQDLMATRAYYNANNLRGKELDELWVSLPEHRATASYGKTWGYYVGMDAISEYYSAAYDRALQEQLDAYLAANPGETAGLGVGCVHFHPLSTPLIEISADGNTAKGMWYSIGQRTELNDLGTADAWWIALRIGADFIRENGVWKLWHLVEICDVANRDGCDYKQTPYIYEDGHPLRAEFGKPTIEMLTHDERFNWWDNYPPEPAPYETYTPETGYGPWGHPDYRKEVCCK